MLDYIVKKYNNTVLRTIKMKLIGVTSDSYAEYSEDSNEKDPKCKIWWSWKNRNIFAKRYPPNCSEEIFAISSIKNTVLWTDMLLMI